MNLPKDTRPFHEVHASLLHNLAAYRRLVDGHRNSHVARSYAYKMAADLETLLARLGLAELPDLTGTGWERLQRSIEAGLVAFWQVVSTCWPEATLAEPGENTEAAVGDYKAALIEPVQSWLIAAHPSEQEPAEEQP